MHSSEHSHLAKIQYKLATEKTSHLVPACSHSHEWYNLCSVRRGDLQQRDRFPLTLSKTYQVRLRPHYCCYYYYYYYQSWRRIPMYVMWSNVTESFISHPLTHSRNDCLRFGLTSSVHKPETSHIISTVAICHPYCRNGITVSWACLKPFIHPCLWVLLPYFLIFNWL